MYHRKCYMISSRVSRCDHKCNTRNAEPEIGPAGSSHTSQYTMVEGYGSWFRLPRCSVSGHQLGPGPNWTAFPARARTAARLPRPVANGTLVFCHRNTPTLHTRFWLNHIFHQSPYLSIVLCATRVFPPVIYSNRTSFLNILLYMDCVDGISQGYSICRKCWIITVNVSVNFQNVSATEYTIGIIGSLQYFFPGIYIPIQLQ